MSCIFCKIVAGDIPSHRAYEDEHVLAFLDIIPLERGHILVVPKVHLALIEDLPDETLMAVTRAVARLARAARQATGASATTLAVNNGEAAGQEIPHFHFHIVPRRAGDGGGPIQSLFTSRASAEDVAEVAAEIRKLMS